MNVHGTMQIGLNSSTMLASVAIALSRSPSLLFPIWPIVRIEATAPSWVFITAHVVDMSMVKTHLTAIVATFYRVLLTLKHHTTAIAGDINSGIGYTDDPLRTLPGSATLSTAKVALSDPTRRSAFLFATPVACNVRRWMLTCSTAILRATPLSMPRSAHHCFTATKAWYGDLLALCYRRTGSTTKLPRALWVWIGWDIRAACQTLHITPHKTSIYAIITPKDAFVKAMVNSLSYPCYWQQRRHEFLDPSKPITASLSDAPDGQMELF